MTTRTKIVGLNREIAETEHETAMQDVDSNAEGAAEAEPAVEYNYDHEADETSQYGGAGQYVAPTLLLIAFTIFTHGIPFLNVMMFNMFTPLLVFVGRFYYILRIKPSISKQ